MKLLIIFIVPLFIAGCGATQTITTTQREVPVVVAVPEIQKTLPVKISDSTIVAKDTVAKIEIRFEVADSIKSDTAKSEVKRKLKNALNTINSLPIKPVADVNVKPDSVKTKVPVTDTTIHEKESVGIFESLKLIAVGFVVCIIIILIIVLLIKLR